MSFSKETAIQQVLDEPCMQKQLDAIARAVFAGVDLPASQLTVPELQNALLLHSVYTGSGGEFDQIDPKLLNEYKDLQLEYLLLKIWSGNDSEDVYQSAIDGMAELYESDPAKCDQFPTSLVIFNLKHHCAQHLVANKAYPMALPFLLDNFQNSSLDFAASPKPDLQHGFRLLVQCLLLTPYTYKKLNALRSIVSKINVQPYQIDPDTKSLLENMNDRQLFPISKTILSKLVPEQELDHAIELATEFNIVSLSQVFSTVKIPTIKTIFELELDNLQLFDLILQLISDRKINAVVDEIDMSVHFNLQKEEKLLPTLLKLLDTLS
ncbi:hypothetical protein OGAPHI_004025 [Ogataea philodendri]|uniref:PCI domain-containing protein n=1 Tax=Ogataea philodendri TaxID=1378263 RepID=A0A9P8P5X7_9ASCO|nr:uncharacterized protein OGAPHI_004025 [Ogataea philodendri]KAH3665837.1 hypothetical protein OGAPHI_004025 [Ogataea philodendri]